MRLGWNDIVVAVLMSLLMLVPSPFVSHPFHPPPSPSCIDSSCNDSSNNVSHCAAHSAQPPRLHSYPLRSSRCSSDRLWRDAAALDSERFLAFPRLARTTIDVHVHASRRAFESLRCERTASGAPE